MADQNIGVSKRDLLERRGQEQPAGEGEPPERQRSTGDPRLTIVETDPIFMNFRDATEEMRGIPSIGPGVMPDEAQQSEQQRRLTKERIDRAAEALMNKYGVSRPQLNRMLEGGTAPTFGGTQMDNALVGLLEAGGSAARGIGGFAESAGQAIGQAAGATVGKAMEPKSGFLGEETPVGQFLREPGTRVAAQDTLGNAFGLLEPFMLPGDFYRTAAHEMHQLTQEGEQGSREAMESGDRRAIEESVREEVVGATDPATLRKTIGGAARRMNLLPEEDASGPLEVRNPGEAGADFASWFASSGWVTYMPSQTWGEYRFGEQATPENTNAVTGYQLADESGLFDLFGVQDERAKQVFGVATEFAMDPLLSADYLFGGAMAARAARSPRIANQLEEAGRKTLEMLTPAGAWRLGRQEIGVLDTAALGVQRQITRFLDAPAPNILGPDQNADLVRGFGWQEEPAVRWRDVLFQRGVSPFDEPARQESMQWLYGGSDFGPNSHLTGRLGAQDYALGAQRAVESRTLRGIAEVDEALMPHIGRRRSGSSKSARARVPSAWVVDENGSRFRKSFHDNLWHFLDEYGTENYAEGLSLTIDNVQEAAKLYGVDPELVPNMVRQASIAARKTVLDVGHTLSRYDEFLALSERAAIEVGLDPSHARMMLETEYAGAPIDSMRRSGVLEGDPILPVGTEESGLYYDYVEALHGAMRESGFSPHLDPLRYLQGYREGYLRRVIGGATDAEGVTRRLQDRTLLSVSGEVGQDGVVERINETFGLRAGSRVSKYMDATPENRYVFETEEIMSLVQEATGRNDITIGDIASAIYQNDSDAQHLASTMELIRNTPPARRPGVTPTHAGSDVFLSQRNELTDEQLSMLSQLTDVDQALAQYGQSAGRLARADTLFGTVAGFLKENNLILDPRTIESELARNPATSQSYRRSQQGGPAIFRYHHQGTDYALIPDSAEAWGELAGMAVPYDFARELVRASRLPMSRQANRLERAVNYWRRGLLAPLPTVARNVLGNIHFSSTAGADVVQLVANLPRAAKAVKEYYRTGEVPGLEGMGHLMHHFNDGKLSGSLGDSLSDMLETLGTVGSAGEVPSWGERLITRFTEDPKLLGFLPAFSWGEDLVRTADAYTIQDMLMRTGRVSVEEANERAVHFAANAPFDYASQPGLAQAGRRTGLAAFPSFSYFNLGRTARTMAERPQKFVRLERMRQGINRGQYTEDEREAMTARLQPWERHNRPTAFNVPGNGGHYVIPTELVTPMRGIDSLFGEVMVGGIANGFLDAAIGVMYANGQSVINGRYGQRVNTPGQPMGVRIGETAGFLAANYLSLGGARTIMELVEAGTYFAHRNAEETQNFITGRFQNQRAAQVVTGLLGVPTREVDLGISAGNSRSFRSRLSTLEAQRDASLASARREQEQAAVAGDQDRVIYWGRRQKAIQDEFQRRLIRLARRD